MGANYTLPKPGNNMSIIKDIYNKMSFRALPEGIIVNKFDVKIGVMKVRIMSQLLVFMLMTERKTEIEIHGHHQKRHQEEWADSLDLKDARLAVSRATNDVEGPSR